MVEVVPADLDAEGQCQEVDEEVVWALRFSCCQWRAELLHLKTYWQMEVAVGWYLVARASPTCFRICFCFCCNNV